LCVCAMYWNETATTLGLPIPFAMSAGDHAV
jgi:hypothetical protein